jgi:hypothetical protein
MAPFVPRGDRSLRVIVTELALAASYSEVLTFARLGEALDLDPDADRHRIRQAVASARPGLLKRHGRALIADRGTGYRVARPGEFAGIAEHLREQGQHRFSRALAVIERAPEADMTPDELRRHRATGLIIRNLNERVSNTEQLLGDARQRLADLEDAVFGRPPATIPGKVDTGQPPAGDSLASLEDSVFRRTGT